MLLMIMFFWFLMGVCIGSFLNVIVYRTVYGESPWKGRSKCPKCKKQIAWMHNIPLLSFFWLKGKCAYCHKKISWHYPVVELLGGVLFVWWFVMSQSIFLLVKTPLVWVQPAFWLGVGVAFLLVLVFDWFYGVIPDGVNVALLVWALGYRLFLMREGALQPIDFANAVLSGVILMLFFYFLYWVTKKKGFGLGDVKLAPALGLVLGWPKTLVGVMAAFLVGAGVSLVLLGMHKKKFGQTIPFGPFLIIGTVIALLWGNQIWEWYVKLIIG